LFKSTKIRIVRAKGAIEMNVFETIQKRRSIRKYQNRPIEKEKLTKVLEAARMGPSAANIQPCHFIIVTDTKIRECLRPAYNADWFLKAPAIIVVCANPKESWQRKDGEEYWKVAIAMQNLILTATELGLGTCWVANFDEKELKKSLNIPKDIKVVAITPLGYPDEEKGPAADRNPLEAMVHNEKW
jgi:nitroreductase